MIKKDQQQTVITNCDQQAVGPGMPLNLLPCGAEAENRLPICCGLKSFWRRRQAQIPGQTQPNSRPQMIPSTFALPVQTAYCTVRELVIDSSRLLRGSIKPHQLLARNVGVSHQPITQLAHWKMAISGTAVI
jgi:hypothetical protein